MQSIKKIFQLFFILTVCLTCLIFQPYQSAAETQYIIKFATVAPEGSTWMKYMRSLAKDILEKSNGRLDFRIFPGAVLGDELDVLRKIRIGQVDCAAFSGVGFGQILPMVRVLDLPFLFRSYQEVDLVHNTLRSFFASDFRKKGFELLAWAEVGNTHLFSKNPVRQVKDLAGLKVWTWSGDPIAKETFSAMGINPIPLAITDVTTAINTGMIDTVYAPPLAALALQWYTSMNYMTALPLVHSTGAVLISSRFMKKLPRDLSDLLMSSFDLAMAELTSALREQNKEAIELIGSSGVTIIPVPSADVLNEFYRIHDRVAQKLMDDIYPRDVLYRVYDILKRPH